MPVCREIFLRYLRQSKNTSNVQFTIIEQFNDEKKFNQGKLQNVGFDIVANEYRHNNWIYMYHPIDLFPCDDMNRYVHHALNIANSNNHTIGFGDVRYDGPAIYYYKSILLQASAYKAINGYSNLYWGWGREDDDFVLRAKYKNLSYYKEITHFFWWDENDTQIRDKFVPHYASPEFENTKSIWSQNKMDPSAERILNINIMGGYNEKMLADDGLSTLTYEIVEAYQVQKNVRQIQVKI